MVKSQMKNVEVPMSESMSSKEMQSVERYYSDVKDLIFSCKADRTAITW